MGSWWKHAVANVASCLPLLFLAAVLAAGCGEKKTERRAPGPDTATERAARDGRRLDSRPAPMAQPVPLWQDGRVARQIDASTASLHGYVILDLSDAWTPYIFTERGTNSEERMPHSYRGTYLALARGETPRDQHGERARRDKYLELYGIMPTLSVLLKRLEEVRGRTCDAELDLTPLEQFTGFMSYQGNEKARRDARQFQVLEHQVGELVRNARVADVAALDAGTLDERDARRLNDYRAMLPGVRAVRAAQARLKCEGYFEGKGRYIEGALDWATHEALAEFERRHRVYGWGFLGRDTLEKLRQTPLDLERDAVLRILTERAMHAAGVIEDGSTSALADGKPRTFRDANGRQHRVPNLEQDLAKGLVDAFGLQTPDSTYTWLKNLGELPAEGERLVAFRGPDLPLYYDGDMQLSVEIDRGDVWYEFPYDEAGRERPQPVTRRPRLTIFTTYLGQKIPLARFGTTIGGWRSESINGQVMWRYKNSPDGPRVWHQIVAAPVWLPPESTPPRELLERVPGKTGHDALRVNYHEIGPSYASAYGLVAAYHITYAERADGTVRLGNDEGIRSHGSVDYMSIMRRHSHGCHRLHNHIAVRLMSFVLAHRPHRRLGQQNLAFRRLLETDVDKEHYEYMLELDQGGYVFELERPVPVNVLEGRIRGNVRQPIEHPIPKFSEDYGAYVLPDGGAVAIEPSGNMHSIPMPIRDGGIPMPDGGFGVPPSASPNALQQLSVPGTTPPATGAAPTGTTSAPPAAPAINRPPPAAPSVPKNF